MTLARIKFGRLKEYELKLSKLGDNIEDIAGKAIYEGAKIVADEVKAQLDGLNTATDEIAMMRYREQRPTYITERAKEGLISSFGVTPLSKDKEGVYNVKLGFDGYNDVKTKKYPNGQPNQLIARACESGSSAMIKQPFFRKAVQATKKKAEARMADILDKEIDKKMGG